MGPLGKSLKTTIHIATTPIDVAKDIVTMGGALTDQDRPYTSQKVRRIADDLGETIDEVNKL